jgi:dTDP-4-dehydrorhamnose reductase
MIIIGASGYLGRRFADYFSSFGYPLEACCYKQKDHCLDLAAPDLNVLNCALKKVSGDFAGVPTLFMTAGISRLFACEQNPRKTAEINVEGTQKVFSWCRENGVKPVFFSTDNVFDGKTGDYSENSALNPLNEYGRQKALMEEWLLKNMPESLILRLGKVYDMEKGSGTLLDEMFRKLGEGQELYAAFDQILCPVFADDVLKITHFLVEGNYSGIFHLCGPESISRYELARQVCVVMGLPENKVIKIKIADLKEAFARPLNTAMKIDKLRSTVDFSFFPLREAISTISFLCGMELKYGQ